MIDNPGNLPIPRTSLTDMVAAYRQAEQDIRTAFRMLVQAEADLKTAFLADTSSCFTALDRHRHESFDSPDQTMLRLKHAAWRTLVDKMGIRSTMSIKRAKELDEQLEGKPRGYGQTVEPLPEITEVNILAMMDNTLAQTGQFLTEAVQEVYDWLRPYRGLEDALVTNRKNAWELGKKVIKSILSRSYKGGFDINYHWRSHVTALDNVFHLLDGQGVVKTHYGPLSDAISAAIDGAGETDYFKFRCHRNLNLHLEFKRLDLVSKFNLVAGGMRLPGMKEAA